MQVETKTCICPKHGPRGCGGSPTAMGTPHTLQPCWKLPRCPRATLPTHLHPGCLTGQGTCWSTQARDVEEGPGAGEALVQGRGPMQGTGLVQGRGLRAGEGDPVQKRGLV